MCLIPGQAKADWSYTYRDDFTTTKAETDSYLHSIFWPAGAYPPSQTYLYYQRTDSQYKLGFEEYNNDGAILGYSFPGKLEEKAGVAVFGNLLIDVSPPDDENLASSGYLQYQLSEDNVNWSVLRTLQPGNHNIPIESKRGIFYIRFRGAGILVDNLDVRLYSYSPTIRVPQNYSTIQQAIDAAHNGDIIEVAPGTYSGPGNNNIDFNGKDIILYSQSGPSQTIINCDSGNRGFYFHSGESRDTVIQGFTIRSGNVQDGDLIPDYEDWYQSPEHPVGGGIYCENSDPSIIDCIIRDCSADLGGGIGAIDSDPRIIDCIIKDCTAGDDETTGYGGGVGFIRDSYPEIINCEITGNSAYSYSYGGGVYFHNSKALLSGCEISYNSATEGAGIYWSNSTFQNELKHCIISNNTACAGGGIYANMLNMSVTNCTIASNVLLEPYVNRDYYGAAIHSTNGAVNIKNSIIWYNEGTEIWSDFFDDISAVFSNIEDGFEGNGNIGTEPMFASIGTNPDYHLQSILGRYNSKTDQWITDGSHSPCIDAGDFSDPVGSESFPNDKRINMGAYGGTTEASKSAGPLIFHVDGTSGNDNNSGYSKEQAFKTIQKAVDEAIDYDIILIWPDIYQEEITLNRKRITIQSADDAAIITAPNGFAFSFFGAESSSCILRNLIITDCGEAAIYCHTASPSLINLTIADNQFGVYTFDGAQPNLKNCILWNNSAGDFERDVYQPLFQYSCIQHTESLDVELDNNISENPKFADPDNYDYHLRSQYGRYSTQAGGVWILDVDTSPCIDQGDPSMNSGREPQGREINMGAFGGTIYASKGGPSW